MKEHEFTDIDVRSLLWAGVIFLAFAVVVQGLVAWGFFWLKEYPFFAVRSEMRRVVPPPEPRLEFFEIGRAERYRKEQMRILNSYGWADRRKGLARIPIQRAMEIYAAP